MHHLRSQSTQVTPIQNVNLTVSLEKLRVTGMTGQMTIEPRIQNLALKVGSGVQNRTFRAGPTNFWVQWLRGSKRLGVYHHEATNHLNDFINDVI